MKKLLFSILACGMCASAFTQPEISEKWVITPVPAMKGVLGRLDINFPADVERNILIYQQADKKFLRSVSRNDKIYTIAPGQYRFTLTNVPVDNVPIQKGHETRLKAGFLDIVSEGDWHLYNDTKETQYTSGNKPKKLPLPVGSYQVKLGGQFYPVIIKDGETVEDYTPAEIKKDEIPGQVNTKIIENDKWVITPTSESEEGRIVTEFPISGMTLNIYYFLWIRRPGESASVFYCRGNSPDHCPETYSLAEGLYDVCFGVAGEAKTNNPIIVPNVPVKKGYETRLKVGYLSHEFRGIYKIYDDAMLINYLSYDYQLSPPPIPLPAGNYTVHMPNAGNFKVRIEDGLRIVQSPVDSSSKQRRWINTPIPKIGTTPLKTETGRIISRFPGAESVRFILHQPRPDGTAYTDIKLDTLNYYDTKPGNYTAELNNVPFGFPVGLGKQTTIRVGFVKFGINGDMLQDVLSGKMFSYGIHGESLKRPIPIGFYLYQPYTSQTKRYLIKLNEGETIIIPVTAY